MGKSEGDDADMLAQLSSCRVKKAQLVDPLKRSKSTVQSYIRTIQCFAVTKKPEIINHLSKEDKEIATTMRAAAEAREEMQQQAPPRRRRAAPPTRQLRRCRRRISHDSSSDATSEDEEVLVEEDDDDPPAAGADTDDEEQRHHVTRKHARRPRRQPATQPAAPLRPAGSAASTGYGTLMYHAPVMMTPAGPSILLPAMSYDSFDPLALLRCASGTSLSTITLPGAGGSVGVPWPMPPVPYTGKGLVGSHAGTGLVANPWAAMSQSGWGAAERADTDNKEAPAPHMFSTVSLLQHAPSIALLPPGTSAMLPQGTSTLLHLDDLLPPGASEIRPDALWPPGQEALGPRLADRVHDSANMSLGFLGTTPTPSGLQLLSDLLQGLGEAPKDEKP